MNKICQTCARSFDPKVVFAPSRYCSDICYQFGERPYSKVASVPDDNSSYIKMFTINLLDKLHYSNHSSGYRADCDWEICVEAKTLGL